MENMNFSEYSAKIKTLGREINLDVSIQTREIISPLISAESLFGVSIQRDIRYGDDPRQRLDIFTPLAGSEKDRPLLIFVHGGGFVAGDKNIPGTPFYDNVGAWAIKNGFNAVNMTYRLAPDHQWPSGPEDINEVIQFVKNQGSEFGLGSDRVFLMGQSAGAVHASAYLAHPEFYKADDHGLCGIILLSGIYNLNAMPKSERYSVYMGDDESLYQERSSLKGLLETDVPILLSISENDPWHFEAQTLELLTALQKRHQQMPRFAYLTGQNHMSVIQYLGLDGDLLGAQIKRFIEEHS
jgi:predicted esterase